MGEKIFQGEWYSVSLNKLELRLKTGITYKIFEFFIVLGTENPQSLRDSSFTKGAQSYVLDTVLRVFFVFLPPAFGSSP
jgi:hypothetical protein